MLGRSRGNQLFKLSIDGRDETNETKIANEFNRYFCNVANRIIVNKIPVNKFRKKFNRYLGEPNVKSMLLHMTNTAEVSKILNSLASKFS